MIDTLEPAKKVAAQGLLKRQLTEGRANASFFNVLTTDPATGGTVTVEALSEEDKDGRRVVHHNVCYDVPEATQKRLREKGQVFNPNA